MIQKLFLNSVFIPSFILFVKTNRGRMCWFLCGVCCYCKLLFKFLIFLKIVYVAATLTGLALFLAGFSTLLEMQKTGLCALVTCCFICFMFA